jgi:tryptophan synthase alpha chain
VKPTAGRIAEKFTAAKREGRAAFVAYLTAGDPSPEATVALARALDRAGADVLELGVPFSDPIADGPTLQRAAQRALAAGTTLATVLNCAAAIQKETNLALVLFSYANPLCAGGFARTMKRARSGGFEGVLMTDVPPEESSAFLPPIRASGLGPIFLVSPTSTATRMATAARLSRGFLYVVARLGTTGERKKPSADLARTIRRARSAAKNLPLAAGFGFADPRSAHEAALLADGVVVGSALVAAAERAGRAREREVFRLAQSFARACRR